MNNSKIELVSTHDCILNTMKPVYFFNKDLNVCEITHGGKKYIIDTEDVFTIINCDKKFNFYDKNDIYPSYKINYKKVSYLDFIYGLNSEKNNYVFFNENCMDLTRKNVFIKPNVTLVNCTDVHINSIEELVKSIYINAILFSDGHCITKGREANKIKNPIWKNIDCNNNEQLIMYCGSESLCVLCPNGYQKILDYEKNENDNKKITFCRNSGGYVTGSNNLYIHQIILECFGNGKGTKNISVDHIDQNPMNNCLNNLRIATREEQEQNSKGIKTGTKRARKSSAKPLPEGITQDMMGKYVCYYEEVVGKNKDKTRSFFKIETHPKLEKIWVGTKSNKIPILEKLTTINKVVDDLENDIYPITTKD